MMEKPADVATLTKEMIIESLGAFNFPRGEFWQNTVGRLFYQPARRFSEVFAKFDQDVASFGISEAAKRLLTVFADTSNAVGQENIPKEGPLLIASNQAFVDELTPYQTSKGAVQFPLDQPIPYDIIRKIVAYRREENLEKARKGRGD
ncbi:MAG: hypothetical protein P8046_09955 [Anaerolineales bacterium]